MARKVQVFIRWLIKGNKDFEGNAGGVWRKMTANKNMTVWQATCPKWIGEKCWMKYTKGYEWNWQVAPCPSQKRSFDKAGKLPELHTNYEKDWKTYLELAEGLTFTSYSLGIYVQIQP